MKERQGTGDKYDELNEKQAAAIPCNYPVRHKHPEIDFTNHFTSVRIR